MAISPTVTVCFDLGGVLARIRRAWQLCADAAGVATQLPGDLLYEINDFPLFDPFQFGSIETNQFLDQLGSYLSVSPQDAKKVHLAILHEPYEGSLELVRELKSVGQRTACLSNTNSLHWPVLNSDAFPAIKELDFKMVSYNIKMLKPEPMVFRRFDLEAEVSPQHVIYFDDHEGNVLAAQRHGWNAFLVDYNADPVQQMRETLRKMEVLP